MFARMDRSLCIWFTDLPIFSQFCLAASADAAGMNSKKYMLIFLLKKLRSNAIFTSNVNVPQVTITLATKPIFPVKTSMILLSHLEK